METSQKTTAMVERNDQLPSTTEEFAAESGVSAKDLVIPRLLLMQPTSDAVKEERARFSEIIDSNEQSVALPGEDIEMIPLKMVKMWRVYDLSEDSPIYLRSEPVTADNERRQRETREDDKPVRFDFCWDFLVLLTKEIKEGIAFPYSITFKRTSAQAGRQLGSSMFKLAMLRQPAYGKTALITTSKATRGKQSWAEFRYKPGRATTEEECAEVRQWIGLLRTANYSVVEPEAQQQRPEAEVIGGEASPSDGTDVPF